MKYTIHEIAKICEAKLINKNANSTVEQIYFDTRLIHAPKNGLFIAFKSSKRDGHDFIKNALEKGINSFLITNSKVAESYKNTNFLLVKDCKLALQKLAIHHRTQYSIPIIGITGSNGKTIVKEWLGQALKQLNPAKNSGSFNSQIGVALSILSLQEDSKIGIFEAGISEPKEMDTLSKMINCDIGILTNIGQAHSEGFESQEQKIDEKIKLFESSKTIIYNIDYPIVNQRLKLKKQQASLISWSLKQDTEALIKINQNIINHRNTIDFKFENKEYAFVIPFLNRAFVENAIHTIITAIVIGVDADLIQQSTLNFESIPMRMRKIEGRNGNIIIDDSYVADLDSLEASLDYLYQNKGNRKTMVILSSVNKSYNPEALISTIQRQNIDELIFIGDDFSNRIDGISSRFFDTFGDLKKYINSTKISDTAVLVKGARTDKMERISRLLSKYSNASRLEINLSNLRHNLDIYKKELDHQTKIMAVIKAAAYGSGDQEIALFLANYGVDYFAVANCDEGIQLRNVGIKTPILVFNPSIEDFDILQSYSLEPEIYSLAIIKEMVAQGFSNLPLHIKLDTGMNRLGFKEDDISELIQIIKTSKLNIKSIFSHLIASDNIDKTDLSLSQIKIFKNRANEISNSINQEILCHILNSSGVFNFPDAKMDMVRIGIGMYGTKSIRGLQAVHSLNGSIIQIKHVKKGEYIGYGGENKAEADMTVAIVNIGYADGIFRVSGNSNSEVMIRSQRYPIIANICMDVCFVNVTADPQITIGDSVEFFGDGISILQTAKNAGTIPYEILSRIASRVRRVYLRD